MPYLWGSRRFDIGHVHQDIDQSHLRWTVDFPEDFELVRAIYAALYPSDRAFTTDDVMQLLDERPELTVLNAARRRSATPQELEVR